MTHTGQRSGITPGGQPCIVHGDSVSAAFEVTGIDFCKSSIVDEHTASRDKIITAAGDGTVGNGGNMLYLSDDEEVDQAIAKAQSKGSVRRKVQYIPG